MRFAVVEEVFNAALNDKTIYFLTGDLNHAKEKEFATQLSKQYLNAGIAEQNMIGMAAGMALSGKKVFAYSISPFVTMRAFEQVKADICYQNLDVTLIGIGGGLIYGQYGNTHCSIEDIAVMRALPNMTIVCPASPMEASQLTKQLIGNGGPTYIRIGRGKEPNPATPYTVTLGKAHVMRTGSDISIIASGTILTEAEHAAELLAKHNISAEVISMHTIKPLDSALVKERAQTRKAIFTLEEHNIYGGLGSAVAEVLAEHPGKHGIFKRFGVHDTYLAEIGTQEYLRKQHGISADTIVPEILKILK